MLHNSHFIQQITDNNREYKSASRQLLRKCPYCGIHKGCNSNRNREKHVTWKKCRKVQYKGQ